MKDFKIFFLPKKKKKKKKKSMEIIQSHKFFYLELISEKKKQ